MLSRLASCYVYADKMHVHVSLRVLPSFA